jgi:hypothetical protein
MPKEDSLEKGTSFPAPLQQRIEDIALFRLDDGIAALTELAPGLTTSISFTGRRVITHEAYTGRADLNRLAQIYLGFDWRCGAEHARLGTRLRQATLRGTFVALYQASNAALARTVVAGIFTGFREFGVGCAYCRGVPAAVIADDSDAFLFDVAEFQKLWPGQRAPTTIGSVPELWGASIEQVREAIGRGADVEKTEDDEGDVVDNGEERGEGVRERPDAKGKR